MFDGLPKFAWCKLCQPMWELRGLIPSPHLLVLATSERFLSAGGTFRAILASESHWLQPVLVLSVHWWPAPAGVGRVLHITFGHWMHNYMVTLQVTSPWLVCEEALRYHVHHEALELFVKYSGWDHGFSPKPWVYESEHKLTHVFSMLKFPCTKSGVGLWKTSFLVCPTRMGGPS
jgi:hypothetical protein